MIGRRKPRTPRPDYFGADDYAKVWRAFRATHPTFQRAVLTLLIIVGVYWKTQAVSFPVLLGIGAFLVIALHRKQPADWYPTDEELARADAQHEREDLEAFQDSGEGERAYEQAVNVLHRLVGTEVTVIAGAGGIAWRPMIAVTGVLLSGEPEPGDTLEDETLVFMVGNTSSFYVDRTQLEHPDASVNYSDEDGLELATPDGAVLRILQESRDRSS
jgi:hypothetical protein